MNGRWALSNDQTHGWTIVHDGEGGQRMVYGPIPSPKKKGAKAQPKRDPLVANPEASAQMLKRFIERIERLEEEERGIKEDKADVYSELKSMGFDAKQVRKIVAMRKMDASDRAEAAAILEVYMAGLGMIV
jgi:uncharacterized protein (UPF0335 family)